MGSVLEGVRIIDFSQWFQGPVAAQHLADFGAEVIHLERPQGGDLARGMATIKAVPVGDWNHYFQANNRNKKSMALDLGKQSGYEIMCRLVEKSDVFLCNLTYDHLQKWRLTYDELRKTCRLTWHCRQSGFASPYLGWMPETPWLICIVPKTGAGSVSACRTPISGGRCWQTLLGLIPPTLASIAMPSAAR